VLRQFSCYGHTHTKVAVVLSITWPYNHVYSQQINLNKLYKISYISKKQYSSLCIIQSVSSILVLVNKYRVQVFPTVDEFEMVSVIFAGVLQPLFRRQKRRRGLISILAFGLPVRVNHHVVSAEGNDDLIRLLFVASRHRGLLKRSVHS
jgi:hypothetical protein